MKRNCLSLLILLISSQSFALCEDEGRLYEMSRQRCDNLTAATETTAGIGGFLGAIFAFPTFGVSLAVGGLAATAPGLAAQNACRIRDERLNSLRTCEQHARDAAARAIVEAREREIRDIARVNRIFYVHVGWNSTRDAEIETNRNKILVRTNELRDQGYDLADPETIEMITEYTESLRPRLERRLREIEEDRIRDVNAQ